jgi:signal recognition particle GTPase
MGKAEKEQVKHYKAIFAALTKNEIENPNLIGREVVERVCAAAKTDAHTVRQFLLMCERLKLLYEYTQLLHRNGEPVPASEEDFIRMQTMDPRFQRLAVKEMAKAKTKNLKARAKPVSVKIK